MASKTRRNRLPKHAATMHGINHWYKHVFEQLGWMILAKAKGYDTKIAAYKMSVTNLIATIKHVMTEYENNDRKHDLRVILMHTELLREKMIKVL
jgi:hypothetical protein